MRALKQLRQDSVHLLSSAKVLVLSISTMLLVLAALPVGAQDAWNVELLGRFGERAVGRSTYKDVWGYAAQNGTELAILGVAGGVSIIDVTNPANPREVGFITLPTATHRDMRTYETYAYAVDEYGGAGLTIIDLSNPTAPILVKNWTEAFDTSHNIHITDGYLYAVGCRGPVGTRSTIILDLADPLNPVQVGAADRVLHDLFVRDDIGYGSSIVDKGFVIMNLSDKTAPSEISFTTYGGAKTHNAWLTDDGHYLLTTDEVAGGDLIIWDVQALNNPFAVASWTANPAAIIHNVIVKGDSAYISYYTEGLQIIDISDPTQPFQVGYYDTWSGSSGGFNGAWGVYPYLPSGNILVSDITSGLYVLRPSEGSTVVGFELTPPELLSASPGQTRLLYFFELQNSRSNALTFIVTSTNTLGWPSEFPGSIIVNGNATELVLVTIDVPTSLAMETVVHVQMCVESTAGFRCATTDVTTPIVLQAFDVQVAAAGVFLRWKLHTDSGDEGDIVVLRAPAATPQQRIEIYRGALAAGEFLDKSAQLGRTWIYTLAWDSPRGLSLLGDRQVRLLAPLQSRLIGNAPNPFNPNTSIRFELAQPGAVVLQVFDSRGRLLRKLEAALLPVGPQQFLWDGRDQRGNSLPSGVYFYQVRSGRWQALGRMTLVR